MGAREPVLVQKLVKEVETPHRYDSGVGVLIVSSAAVFIALLGAAMMMRARVAPPCHARTAVIAPAVAPRAHAAAKRLEAPPCGEPVFHQQADGTLKIEYTVCATEPPRAGEPAATRLPANLRLHP